MRVVNAHGEWAEVKKAVVNVATIADHPIVTAVTGRKITVTSYKLVAAGAVGVTWKSATTALEGKCSFAANGGVAIASGNAETPVTWTEKGQALNLALDAAVQVSGHVTYFEE